METTIPQDNDTSHGNDNSQSNDNPRGSDNSHDSETSRGNDTLCGDDASRGDGALRATGVSKRDDIRQSVDPSEPRDPSECNGTSKAVGPVNNDDLSRKVIGLAIEVHRQLGPGLLESAYEECLCFELRRAGIPYARQRKLPIHYKGFALDYYYQIDIVVDDSLIVEVKSVERITPVHEAQLLTYLRLSGIAIGLLLNFNAPILKDGIRRRRV
jgi:GxxExxY protein